MRDTSLYHQMRSQSTCNTSLAWLSYSISNALFALRTRVNQNVDTTVLSAILQWRARKRRSGRDPVCVANTRNGIQRATDTTPSDRAPMRFGRQCACMLGAARAPRPQPSLHLPAPPPHSDPTLLKAAGICPLVIVVAVFSRSLDIRTRPFKARWIWCMFTFITPFSLLKRAIS